MVNWYVKGGSVFDNSSCKLYFYLDLGGYDKDDYETRDDSHIQDEDPYIHLGGAGGGKTVVIGLYTDYRIEIDNVNGIRGWDEVASAWVDLLAGGGGLQNIIEDLSPQLGADLDCRDFDIENIGTIYHQDATDWLLRITSDGFDGGTQYDIGIKWDTGANKQLEVVGYNTLYLGTRTDHDTIDITSAGVRIGGAGARITTIENNDALGASDTKLCTQGNVKAYHDAHKTVAGDLNHNDLANLNAGDNYEHITQTQKNTLHAEAHVLATTGPHTGTLPWGDLNKTGSSLAHLVTRAHSNLSDAPADAHHAKQHLMDDITQHTRADNAVLDASTSFHGFLKKLDNVATHYINGQGNWSVPAGGNLSHNDIDNYYHIENSTYWMEEGYTNANLQSAIDAAEANGGGIIYLPEGTCVITTQITITDTVHLIGVGRSATILTDNCGNTIMIMITGDYASLRHLTLNSNDTGDTKKVYLQADYVTLIDVDMIDGIHGSGQCMYFGGANYCLIDNCYFYKSDYCIQSTTAINNYNTIRDCHFYDADMGIYIVANSDHNILIGNKFREMDFRGIACFGQYNIITHNHFRSGGIEGIEFVAGSSENICCNNQGVVTDNGTNNIVQNNNP